MLRQKSFLVAIAIVSIMSWSQNLFGQSTLSPSDLLSMKSCSSVDLSPDGSEILYTLSTPRGPNDTPGGSVSSYWRLNVETGESTLVFSKGEYGYYPAWMLDGSGIAFLTRKSGEPAQVWKMGMKNENWTQLTWSEISISSFKMNPNGKGLVFMARTPDTEKEADLKKRGYGFIFYEENLKNNNLYAVDFVSEGKSKVRQLTEDENVWDFEINNAGTYAAASISPKNLIDHKYMFRKINLIDLSNGKKKVVSENGGKLGNYSFSPDDTKLAYTASRDINDHQVSQVFISDLHQDKVINITDSKFKGHVSWAKWKDNSSVLIMTGEGVYPKLSLLPAQFGGKREIILDSKDSGIIFSTPDISSDFRHFAFTASTPSDGNNVYSWDGDSGIKKLTNINPFLSDRKLGKQEVFKYAARDGREIEGILMYPVGYELGKKYPLVLHVHGGPESHHSNNWLSRYATPGQVMTGKGYMVAYINYRASTGYGVDFAMEGFMDPAGKEFDDLADGIDYLIEYKGADRSRVGMAGGSYGGYASAWFATYYTKYVKAVCMFVGISDVASKRLTTDIAWEEYYVHSGKPLEEQWKMNLERSPIYYAHQSRTATLIYGGASDTRVHPSQSLELYRLMKMNEHPAVRLVQYPGEGHGNRKQVGQIDVLYRQLSWMDWYVRDLKPLDGGMPKLDISDAYGLEN